MLKFLLDPGNLPFTVALGVMVGLAVMEAVSALLGFGISELADHAIDFDVDAPDADGFSFGDALAWLHVGTVPLLVLLIIFLTTFGLTGLAVQSAANLRLSPWVASIPAFVAGLAGMRVIGGFAGRVLIKDETTAVSQDSLLGHVGTITLGATSKGSPSQAKLKDKHGQTHYVLIEPLRDGDTFNTGDNVMLVQRDGPKYYVIEDSVETLLSLGSQDLSAEHRQKA
jgi:hypothetical protein